MNSTDSPSAVIQDLKLPEGSVKKLARVIIYKATSENGPWEVVPPEKHPKYIKDEEVMGKMLAGFTAQAPGSALLYRAERLNLGI